ncbi:MAG: hypothetical protein JWQ33_401 [Ramlibacter sp.]|nr:hypothetical protein [Ramlibacter sp.]
MLARAAKILLAAAGVLFLVLVVLAAGLWWWSGTEGSLAWALDRAARSQPLRAEGVTGSLRSALTAQRLVWEKDGLRIEANQVRLEWQPLSLLAGELKLEQLHAASVQVTDTRPRSGEPMRAPRSLALPLRVDADLLAIDRFGWNGSTAVQVTDLKADYVFEGDRHQLRLDGVTVASGRYRGQVSVAATEPMAVDARLQGTVTTSVPASTTTVPLVFTATVQGPMARLDARARVGLAPGTSGVETQPAATLTAVVTPFSAQPVPQAQASLRSVDLHAFWAQAPQTGLSGDVRVQPAGTATWALTADLTNAEPGPWDAGRLPLDRLRAQGEWRGGMALVRSLQAALGGASLQAEGSWSGTSGWQAEGSLRNVDPAALHSKLAAAPLGGPFQVRQDGERIAFDAALRSAGPPRAVQRRQRGSVPLLELRELTAQGSWAAGVLVLPHLTLRTTDASLQGSLTARPGDRSGTGTLQLRAPGVQAKAEGGLAAASGRGTVSLQANDLALAQRWLQSWPFVPAAIAGWRVGGQLALNLAWQGGWTDPAIQAAFTAPTLTVQPASTGAGATTPWTLRDAHGGIDGRLGDATLDLRVRAEQGQRTLALDLSGRGGLVGPAWRARIARLQVELRDPAIGAGSWRAGLRDGVEARWLVGPKRLEVDPGQAILTAPTPPRAAVSQAALSWDAVRWGGGELQTAGRLAGLPMAWIELVGGPQLAGSALTGNLVFDAQWNARLGAGMRLDASLVRTSGDITVAVENAEGLSSRVAAGVREARVTLQGRDGAMAVALQWESEQAGMAKGTLETRLVRGGAAGWEWAADAPLAGRVQAQVPRVGVWSLLAPPGWRLRGSVVADVAVSGTRSEPQFSGTLRADELALRSVVDGIELRNGSLRARLQGQRLVVEEFVLHGAGPAGSGGSVVVSGEGRWVAGAPQLQATAQLERLRASIRSDRELTVSGRMTATLAPAGAAIQGNLTVDQGRIVIPDETPPRLGADVVVRNAPGVAATATERAQKKPAAAPPKRPLTVAVQVDLGRDFRLSGRGIDTRLAGTLAVSGNSLAMPRMEGTIRAVDGEYQAYGQHLQIERGVLRFTGAVDNPSLDVLAIRPRLEQRVGVMITGQAQAPFVRLYSEPDMPDADKLSWLVVGRATPSGGAESALLQQAALALLASRRGGANSGGIAGRFGLDELSVRRDDTAGAVVTLGKRFARDFYASYESSLGGALGTLNIFYDVSRRLTVRARTGETTAVDLIFTLQFD